MYIESRQNKSLKAVKKKKTLLGPKERGDIREGSL